ncbi:DUF4034 domain-containing protein [Massilia sp. CCM 9210]|uniref:DUF4034 domain-containing protein n=1 Tax=Massilia scottii TaxID=3057166 RepID=UPI002796DD4B|nr:DUF4034 domain-containing protein [Massilia sp. CCM 9210]MDQ1811908.1 DUF4034 domain-containing protein [Massilia sp. CCM 9210]
MLLVSMQSAYAGCSATKRTRPTNVVVDEVQAIFEKKDYKKLDALYASYLEEKSMTADSISTLQAFFEGIEQSFDTCGSAPVTEDTARAQEASLRAWRKASPRSPAPKLALAFFTAKHAWFARGTGYGGTVSPAQWQLFKRRMASARAQLDALAPTNKTNPAWYAAMLNVGLAQGETAQKFDALYEKGVALAPYYMDLHYEAARYHSERWHGSREEFNDVVERAVQLTEERLGQTMYTRMHWTHSQSRNMFMSGDVHWPRMKTGFEDILTTFDEKRTRNYLGTFACIAEDASYLKKQLDVLGAGVDPAFWGSKRNYAYCMALAQHSDTGRLPVCVENIESGDVKCD